MRWWLALPLVMGMVAEIAAQPDAKEPAKDQRAAAPAPQPGQGTNVGAAAPPAFSKMPRLKTPSEPTYPPHALRERVAARVIVEIEIKPDGLIGTVTPVSVEARRENGDAIADPAIYEFDKAATVAAALLEFEPAEVGGKPVAVRVNYTYEFVLPAAPAAERTGTTKPTPKAVVNYRGVVVERGTRSELSGAKVTVYRGEGSDAEGYEATTNERGQFEFFDLALGTWNVEVTLDGYYTFKTDEVVAKSEVTDARYYCERRSYNPYALLVEAERPKKEVNRRTISGADLEKVPGTLGDPVLVIENLPGVARTLGGEIIVRGSGPQDTAIFIDGSSVPLIYHFGGLRSVVPASVVDSVDFYPGNYSVQYGRAMGGVFDLHIKRLEPDRIHGSADISILDTSLYLEVPLGDKAAIAVAGRRSYIDYILNAVIPDDASVQLTSAPRYYDYQILGNWRPQPKHDFRWLFLGSDDLFRLLFDDATDTVGSGAQGNDLSATTSFQRVAGEYNFAPSKDIKHRTRLAVGRDVINFSFVDVFRLEVLARSVELRDVTSIQLHEQLELSFGMEGGLSHFKGAVLAPPLPREGASDEAFDPDELTFTTFNAYSGQMAGFVEGEWKLAGWTVVPGLRLDYFGSTNSFSVDPRVVGRYDFVNWSLKGGAGLVHQSPDFPDLNKDFGNPDLGLQRVWQYSGGVEWRPTDFLKGDLTFFYKDMQNLVSASPSVIERDGETVPERVNNGGVGRVYGLETFVEHSFAHNLRGWMSYTLNRAERRDFGSDSFRLFDFDQTHIFAIVGSYLLPRNWELGLRWRIVSGNPYTPILRGVFNSDLDVYEPIYAGANTARIPSFQALDLRVDKSWVFDTWRMSAYLSVINSYNHKNPEAVSYSFDYSEQGFIFGLPIIPILGAKGQW